MQSQLKHSKVHIALASSDKYPRLSQKNFRLKEMPADEMPRERLMAHGAKSLSDAELLAIILRTGSADLNALEMARTILRQKNGIKPLSRNGWEDLISLNGIGKVKAVTLEAIFEFCRRINMQQEVLEQFTQPSDLHAYFGPKLKDLHHEVFVVVLANNANRIIVHKEIAKGTKTATLVDVQEVIKLALVHNATSIILIHNHPSGNPVVSQADKMLTKKITDAASYFNLRVLDHLIIAGNTYVSFREDGLLV